MRTDQLECLIEIGKTNSIHAASEKLHLTPQAVSASVKNLEKELGLPLLIKTTKHTILTDTGKELVIAANDFFKQIMRLQTMALPEPQLSGTVNILTTPGITESLFPHVVCDFMQSTPELKINIHTIHEQDLFRQVAEHDNFVGMLFCNSDLPFYREQLILKQLEFFPLLPCKFVARIPANNPLASYASVSMASLLYYPIIIQDPQRESSSIVRSLAQYGRPPKFIYETNSSVVLEMVARGLGITFGLQIPFKPAKTFSSQNMKIVPIKEDLKLSLSYILKKNTIYPDLVFYFLDLIDQYLNQHSNPFSSYTL